MEQPGALVEATAAERDDLESVARPAGGNRYCGGRRGCGRSAPLGGRLVRLRGRVVGGPRRARARRIRSASLDRVRARAQRAACGRSDGRRCPRPARGRRRGNGHYAHDPVVATGTPAYVAAPGELPAAPDEKDVYAQLGILGVRRTARGAVPRRAADAATRNDIRGDLHMHSTWSDGKASILGDGDGSASSATTTWRLAPHAERACRPRA
jgi:hypothetical protein